MVVVGSLASFDGSLAVKPDGRKPCDRLVPCTAPVRTAPKEAIGRTCSVRNNGPGEWSPHGGARRPGMSAKTGSNGVKYAGVIISASITSVHTCINDKCMCAVQHYLGRARGVIML